METFQSLLIRRNGRPLGPFSLEELRELTASGAVTRETEVAPDAGGPWARIEMLPLGTLLFPPAPKNAFKTPDYERANDNTSPPINLHDIIAAANTPRPPTAGNAHPPSTPPSASHDVHSLLQFNYAIDKKRGLFNVAPRARKSRRTKDYRLLLAGGAVLIFTVLLAVAVIGVQVQVLAAQMPGQFWPILRHVLFHSPILAWGAAMWAFYAVALGWVMFVVMEDH